MEVSTEHRVGLKSSPPNRIQPFRPIHLPTSRNGRAHDSFRLLNKKAEKALIYYKETEGEDYEPLRVWTSESFFCIPFVMHHLNFLARRKDGRLDDSARLFFAEVGFSRDGEFVNCCVMLDAGSSGMINGCAACDDVVIHPKGVKFFRRPPNITPQEGCGGASSATEETVCETCGVRRPPNITPQEGCGGASSATEETLCETCGVPCKGKRGATWCMNCGAIGPN